MTSTETRITFETLPKAVEEIKVELAHLKGTVERLVELNSGTQRDSWMNIDQLRAYHPDHPAKSTIYEWVGQNRIPVHKDGKKLRFLKSEIDEWLAVVAIRLRRRSRRKLRSIFREEEEVCDERA